MDLTLPTQPPQPTLSRYTELQTCVIGLIHFDSDYLHKIHESYITDSFIKRIFSAAKRIIADGSQLSPITIRLAAGLTDREYDLYKSLCNTTFTHAEGQEVIKSLREESARTALKQAVKTADFDLQSKPAFQVGQTLAEKIAQIAADTAQTGVLTHIDTLADDYFAALYKRFDDFAEGNNIQGLPFGFEKIDAITGGFRAGEFIIIGARPGIGKTSFALRAAINQCEKGKKVAFFNLEMNKEAMINRLVSQISGVPASVIRNGGNLEQDEFGRFVSRPITTEQYRAIAAAVDKARNYPFWIADKFNISASEISQSVYELKCSGGCDVVYVDYIGLIRAEKNGNSNEILSDISRKLKICANTHKVPVIALSQLSRDVAKGAGDKRPQLTDLRDSGALEQDANFVAFLHRPEYYGIMQDEGGRSTAGLAEFICRKNRDGLSGFSIDLEFKGTTADFAAFNEYNAPTTQTPF